MLRAHRTANLPLPLALLIAVLTFWMPPAGLCQTGELRLGSASASPGSSVSLDLTLSGAAPASFQFTAAYDPLDFTSVEVAAGPAALAAGKSVSCSGQDGAQLCVVWGLNSTPLSGGTVAVVTAAVNAASSAAIRGISIS